MDWFQWLSKTTLHPSLVYNYGVLFASNDLTLNDIPYFDHDFLLSMGVKIGKHRLEILKLARAETHRPPISIKSFVRSVSETMSRGLARCAKKLSGRRKLEAERLSFGRKLSPLMVEWKEIREDEVESGIERFGDVGFDGSRFLKSPGTMADSGEKTVMKSRPIGMRKLMGPGLSRRKFLSGPINGGKPFRAPSPRFSGPINGGKPLKAPSPRFSGPLDERLACCKSPSLSGQLDVCYGPTECHSPWAMLFEDLRPN